MRTALLLAAICLCVQAQIFAQAAAPLLVDLAPAGLTGDALAQENAKSCLYAFLGYRTVRWLDNDTLLLAFNLSPMCSATSIHPEGKAKLVTFNWKGELLHSAEFSYDAGVANASPAMARDGVWIGPDRTLLVSVPQTPDGKEGETKGDVLVFSRELAQVQELPTFTDIRHNKGFSFLGVPWDQSAAIFFTERPRTDEWACRAYTGNPLADSGRCDLAPGDRAPGYEVSTLAGVSKGQQATYAGKSADGSRLAVFLQKKSDMCLVSQLLCTWQGSLVVLDRKTHHRYFESKFPANGRADLSPDGKHLATFAKGMLEIFALP